MNEAKLARKLRLGDRPALNQAIDAYTPYLTTVVWHTIGPTASAEDVEEIISDVFLALWSHRANLCPELGLKSWLAAAARNKAIDRLCAAPPAHLPLDEAAGTGSVTPEEDLEQRMFAAALRQAVEDLPPPDGQLVFRYYYEEEKLKDIAKDLGLSVPAAKSRLLRARRKLKEVLTRGGLANDTVG